MKGNTQVLFLLNSLHQALPLILAGFISKLILINYKLHYIRWLHTAIKFKIIKKKKSIKKGIAFLKQTLHLQNSIDFRTLASSNHFSSSTKLSFLSQFISSTETVDPILVNYKLHCEQDIYNIERTQINQNGQHKMGEKVPVKLQQLPSPNQKRNAVSYQQPNT